MADAVGWIRNEAPQNTKGVKSNVSHADGFILREDPCLVEYAPIPAAKHWWDSHGSLDHIKTSDIPGAVVEFVHEISCSGPYLFVTYQKWQLIPGSNTGCGELLDPPTGRNEWIRNIAPIPTKGENEWQIILPICNPDMTTANKSPTPCADFTPNIGKPICGQFMDGGPNKDPIPVDPRAVSGFLYRDSHGNLDKVVGINYKGPGTQVIIAAWIDRPDCPPGEATPAGCPPTGDIGKGWRLRWKPEFVNFQPGSKLLLQRTEAFVCCACCRKCGEPCPPAFTRVNCCSTGPANLGQCVPNHLKVVVEIAASQVGDCEGKGCAGVTGEGDLNLTSSDEFGQGTWEGTASVGGCSVALTLKCILDTLDPNPEASCLGDGVHGWSLEVVATGDCCDGSGFDFSGGAKLFNGNDNPCCCPLCLTFATSLGNECCGCTSTDSCCGLNVYISEDVLF